jgi:hypothetical protein
MSATNIKCSRCDEVKNRAAYSNKQLRFLDARVAAGRLSNPSTIAIVSCSACTSNEKVEEECSECGIVKGREKFNKTLFKAEHPVGGHVHVRRFLNANITLQICNKCKQAGSDSDETAENDKGIEEGDDDEDGDDEEGGTTLALSVASTKGN